MVDWNIMCLSHGIPQTINNCGDFEPVWFLVECSYCIILETLNFSIV